jgi:hypothetical protein
MAIRSKVSVVIAAWITLCLHSSLLAQQVQDPCRDMAQGPTDASLVLSQKDRQAVYREGEIIALTLAYTSSVAEKYSLDTRNYDRSGRLNAETFCIEPASGRDPLEDYFSSGLFGFLGGGIGGAQPLSSAAATIDIELNEWKSLPPGRYQLRLVSSRVQRQATAGETGGSILFVPLRSNTIEFQIVGAPDWQASELDSAIRALDSGLTEESKRHGARVLRFLGSDAATRELAKRFADSKDQVLNTDLKFGLIGSPRRQVAIDAMKAAITNPQYGIRNDFIETLALLEVQTKSEYDLPLFTEANRAAWDAARERKLDAYRAAIAQHRVELSGVVGSKTGTAFAITIDTLLAAPPASADRAGLQQMLVASWDSLPLRTRNELIAFRWKDIKGPDMMPILRGIVDTPRDPRSPAPQPERGPALSRIYELSPGEGRELILREMLNTKSDVGMDVLGLLPDRELPEIEEPLLVKLRSSGATYVDYQLIERYATAKPLAEMKSLYEKNRGKWACDPQKSFLNYFLKNDRVYGIAQVKDALRQRQATGCYRSVLTDLRSAIAMPELEQLAIAALNDPSPEVTRDAADALGRYGSASAEDALWKRLETFHEKWKDRTDELRTTLGARGSEGSDAASLEYFLIAALTQGQAWVADRDKLERLTSLVSPPRQNELRSLLTEWQQGRLRLSANWLADGSFRYSIARYSGDSVEQLTRKLRQFPKGTRIALLLAPSIEAEHRSEVDIIREAAGDAGIIVELNR